MNNNVPANHQKTTHPEWSPDNQCTHHYPKTFLRTHRKVTGTPLTAKVKSLSLIKSPGSRGMSDSLRFIYLFFLRIQYKSKTKTWFVLFQELGLLAALVPSL